MARRERVWVMSLMYEQARAHRVTWPYRTREREGSGSVTGVEEQLTDCGRGVLSRASYSSDGSGSYSFYGVDLYADQAEALGLPKCRVCFR